ncbi:MAG: hypothetical protein IPL39_09180 [Opitutaceae bacterium]|nr:hypothetical protein [Opitutaceae bacterium]
MLKRALGKHAYTNVARLYHSAGYGERVTAWGLCSMAIFREEHEVALAHLAAACPTGADLAETLELDGPLPVPEGWRAGFTRGTLLCQLGRAPEAIPCFDQASAFDGGACGPASAGLQIRRSAPDLLNNWGVALAQTGQLDAGRAKFAAALELSPGYLDARLNLEAAAPSYLTSHPLRRQPSRSEY